MWWMGRKDTTAVVENGVGEGRFGVREGDLVTIAGGVGRGGRELQWLEMDKGWEEKGMGTGTGWSEMG